MSVLGLAILGILLVIGGLLAYGTTTGDSGADLAVEVQRKSDGPSGQDLYQLKVFNRGSKTAEEVVVEVSSGQNVRDIEFKSVPKGDGEEAMFLMPAGQEPPTAEVTSYKEPS